MLTSRRVPDWAQRAFARLERELVFRTGRGVTLMQDIVDLPVLAHGTYTPTLTNVTNLDASTAYACQYLRIGNTVTVSGRVDVDPTAAALIELGLTLPVASDFSASTQCAGVAASSDVAESGVVRGDTTNNRAQIDLIAASTANHLLDFTFTYQVI